MNQRKSAVYRAYQGLVTLVWTDTILLQYIRAVVLRLPLLGKHPDTVMTMLYLFFMLGASGYMLTDASDWLFLVGSSGVYLFSGVVAYNDYWRDGAFAFLVQTLPLYIIGSSLLRKEHREEMLHLLYVLSLASVVLKIVYTYTLGDSMNSVQSIYQGDMDAAYKLLPHVCMVMLYAFRKPDWCNVPISIVGAVFLTMLGTRGAVLIMLLFLFYCMVTRSDGKLSVLRVGMILMAGIAFLYSSLFQSMVARMHSITVRLGMSARVFDKVLTSSINSDSGRGEIQKALLEQIMQKPLTGYGLFGDRGNGHGYAHQLFIELWTQFGVIIGSAVGIFFVCIPVAAFFRAKEWKTQGFIMLLIGCGIVKLFLSGTYLNERMLFLLLGCSSCILRESYNEVRKN